MRNIDYQNLPEADVVLNYIKTRKKKGLYTLILTSGLPGTGKSSMDLRLAELTSLELAGENIVTEENIIDDVLGLIKFIRNADEKKVCIAVIEEISVLFPSRRAMSHDNVAVGKILDTARKKQVILFANAPLWTSVDSHIRALGNIYIETLRINRKEGVVIAKALRLQTNPGSGKTYFHWLKRKTKEVHRIFVKKPNSDTWKKYEDRKDVFMDELYEDLRKKTMKKLGKKEKIKTVKALTPRELQVYDLVLRKGLNQSQAARELGVSSSAVHLILNKVKKKTNYKDNEEKPKKSSKNLPKQHKKELKQKQCLENGTLQALNVVTK